MGIFDKMFGQGAQNASEQDKQRFEQLKGKYQTALRTMEQKNVRLENLHIQDGKLFVRGVAPSEQAKNDVWNQIKLVDPTYSDLTADIRVEQTSAAGAAGAQAGAGSADRQERSYTVAAGDTLSKISKQMYGDANQYMRIFEANRDQLSDPDKIRPGQRLVIP
jgi:hypothetical protein